MVQDKKLPVFIVEGPNWTCEVALNETNAEFPHEEQAFEASTQAVEAFKGIKQNDTFELKDPNGEPPYMSLALFAYLKNTDPDKTGVYIPSHIAFGNAGLYKDSQIAFTVFVKHIEKAQAAEAERQRIHDEEVKNFEKLKGDLKKAKTTRKRKPKSSGDGEK